MKIKIKPISVNQVWQGRRYKTDVYKDYENHCMKLLGAKYVPSGPLEIEITVGLSNKLSDLDNVAKPFIDILQKKYGFNDRDIYELHMVKKDVKKGEEYIDFEIYYLGGELDTEE